MDGRGLQFARFMTTCPLLLLVAMAMLRAIIWQDAPFTVLSSPLDRSVMLFLLVMSVIGLIMSFFDEATR